MLYVGIVRCSCADSMGYALEMDVGSWHPILRLRKSLIRLKWGI